MSITAVVLENNGASALSNVPFTFGQVFKKGDVPGSSAVTLTAPNGSLVPCQINVHNTHSDGSVRHASLSAVIPSMAASSSTTYGIDLAASGPTGAAPAPADYPSLSATVTVRDNGIDVTGPVASPVTYTADLAALLAANAYRVGRSGPIMSDWIVRAPLKTAAGVEHPHLHARFIVQVYKGQQRAHIRVLIENDWAKPKAVMPTTGSPWEAVSNVPQVYWYEVKIGGVVVDERKLNGFHHVPISFATSGTYSNFATGLPSDSTVYTAAATIDGVRKDISVTGSAVQTFGQLFSAITAQLGGLGTAGNFNNGGCRITSKTTGAGSTVVIDYGTLFPAMQETGLSASTTTPVTYTASVDISGTVKALSIIGNQAQSIGRLCALINTQLGGIGKAVPQAETPGFRIVNPQGTTAGVTVTDGNLLSKMATAYLRKRRPMRGDEYIHYGATFWTKRFWWGGEPDTHIRHDKAYLIATQAFPNYSRGISGDADKIAANLAEMNRNGGIGQNGITKASMGAQGYAPGIGVLPEWAAMYIISQNRDAKRVMLQQADLIGSWSMHAREYDTDRPISFAKWPCATWSPTAGDSKNSLTGLQEKLPTITEPSQLPSNGNDPDCAHHPDFGYVPYIVTGDPFYLECLLFHFNYTILDMNAAGSYRGGGQCLFKAQPQVRGQAWAMRTMAHTLYALPDAHSRKAEIAQIMANNVQWYNGYYADTAGAGHNIFGFFPTGMVYSRNGQSKNSLAPWQEHFVIQALGRAVELGYREWLPLLRFKSAFISGSLTSGSDFCWYLATNYTLQFRDTATTPFYTTWAEVYNKGFSASITTTQCSSPEFFAAIAEKVGGMSGYPDLISGFPANMQPAVAYTAMYKMPGCENAWEVFDSRQIKPNYNLGPQFAIEPRALTEVPEVALLEARRSGTTGLGGAMSDSISGADIFDNVLGPELAQTRVEYRCEYFVNNYPKTIYGASVWLSANTPSPGTVIEVGLGASPVNGTEQTIANETTAPAGVTFSAAATKAAAVLLGDLPAGARRAVWYRRTTNAGTAARQSDTFTRTFEGEIE